MDMAEVLCPIVLDRAQRILTRSREKSLLRFGASVVESLEIDNSMIATRPAVRPR